jgi:YidC/Oxa1 family membrane protein insertase
MERRVLLAIVLSFLVIYLYQAFLAPPPRRAPAPSSATAPATQPGTQPQAGGAAVPGAKPAPVEAAPSPTPSTPAAAPVVSDSAEREIRIESREYVATLTNRGARLKSWRLKHYLDEKGEPVELVTHEFGDQQPMPFSLRVPDEGLTRTMNSALYAVAGTPSSEGPIAASTDVTFEYRDSAGLNVSKRFRFEPASYLVSFGATVASGDQALQPAIQWGPALGDVDSATGRYAVAARGLYTLATDVKRVTRVAPADVVKQAVHQGDFHFAGVDDHYFMATALGAGPSKITFEPLTVPAPAGSTTPPRALMAFTLEPGRLDPPIRFYIGPKAFDVLFAIEPNLTNAIDFGFFRIIVAPLLRTLNSINGVIGNYGWSIVLLTVVINLIMFPLRHKQVVSMRKMQAIQPEVKVIQDRYAKLKATDPAKQKMNQELMQLYRDRGVNPAAGCVPMLIPFPVLIAFYALLTTAIELRGAPFAGWIHDLSRPDPYYIAPVFMVVSQVVQQWMMPPAGVDPMQQKMMLFMPLVLGFIFLSFPAGVVLYWIVNTAWAIGQQAVTNKWIGPPNVKTVRPAAERQLKVKNSG